MKKTDLDYIEEELAHEEEFVHDFSIKAKWTIGEHPSRLMEVSRLFISLEEMEEAGIDSGSRTIVAYSPSGREHLLAIGFSSDEIKLNYEKNTNTSTDTR